MFRLLAALLTLLPALALADITGPATVIDGDSLEINGERIRLHGIDAPETRQSCRLDGKPWRCGEDAMSALAGKIGRQRVTCRELDRDTVLTVAKCSVAGVDLAEWLVLNGWAAAYHLYSYEYSRAEQRAKSARLGIWASEFEMPWAWRRCIEGRASPKCLVCGQVRGPQVRGFTSECFQ